MSGKSRTPRTYRLDRAVQRRSDAAAAALRGLRVYGDHSTTLSDILENGILREVERLERLHNNGRPFPAGGRPTRGRPPGLGSADEGRRGPWRRGE